MCKDCCEHPEKLKGKPEECSGEQIKECHWDTKEHPCESEKSRSKGAEFRKSGIMVRGQ